MGMSIILCVFIRDFTDFYSFMIFDGDFYHFDEFFMGISIILCVFTGISRMSTVL